MEHCAAMKMPGSRHLKSRGQSLVEAAITLPIVLLLSMGVTDIGRSFYYRASTSGGPLAVTITSAMPPSGGQIATIANQAALESSKDGTGAGSAIAGATLTVTFHCLNGAAVTNATGNGSGPSNAGSDSITASISKPMSVITPLLWPMTGGSYPIKITSSQRTEY
jgi:hypothetical protein